MSDDVLTTQRRLVGGVIARPDLIPVVEAILNGGAALDTPLRLVYRAVHPTDSAADTGTIIERLGGYDQAGATIRAITDSSPAAFLGDLAELGWGQRADSIEHLARIVHEQHRARAAASILRAAAKRIEDDPATLDDSVADANDYLAQPDMAAPNRYRSAGVTARDLAAEPIDRPAGILGEGIITATEYTVLYGRPGLGKSYLLLQLAIAIAEGAPFFGETTTHCRVGVISLELSSYYLQRRLVAICGQRLPPADVVVIPCDRLRTLLDLAAPRDQENLAAWCRGEGLSLLVIDPLAIAHRGRETQEDLSPIVRFLREFPGRSGASPLLAHHEAKPGDEPITDDLKALRGAGILGDLAGTLIRLKETRGKLCMCWPKVRHGKTPETTWLAKDSETGVLYEVEPPEEMAAAKAGAVRAKIAEFMTPGLWYRSKEIETATGIAHTTLFRYLRLMGAVTRGETRSSEWSIQPDGFISSQNEF